MIVYFAGCMATYREKNIAKTTIQLLKKIDAEFTMLGKDEWCCGSVMLRTGNIETVKQLMEHNVKAIRSLGADTVVTSCAGCYRTIKQDYPKYIGDLGFEVLHTPEFILKFIDDGKLKFKSISNPSKSNSTNSNSTNSNSTNSNSTNSNSTKSNSIKVTYHDPCHLGRHMNIYDPPRKVLQAIAELELVEMPRSRENARCCGSGGGVSSGYRELSNQMADTRIKDALSTNAKILTSACPFCTYALKSATERANAKNKLKVLDFSELILDYLE